MCRGDLQPLTRECLPKCLQIYQRPRHRSPRRNCGKRQGCGKEGSFLHTQTRTMDGLGILLEICSRIGALGTTGRRPIGQRGHPATHIPHSTTADRGSTFSGSDALPPVAFETRCSGQSTVRGDRSLHSGGLVADRHSLLVLSPEETNHNWK